MTTKHATQGRGCGTRNSGKLYVCSGVGPSGMEIENFVVDPIVPWPVDWHRGMELMGRSDSDIKDLVIFVGGEYYPSLWDFVEEAGRYGTSRKLTPSIDISKLTPGQSKMLFVHAKALPKFKVLAVKGHGNEPYAFCKQPQLGNPKDYPKPVYHANTKLCTFGHKSIATIFHQEDRMIKGRKGFQIKMPSFAYYAEEPENYDSLTEKTATDFWKPGVFLVLPITNFEAKDFVKPEDQDRVNKAGFNLDILDY